MRLGLAGLVLWAALGLAAPVRLVLSVGHDVGHAGDATLAWAEADARKVRDVFVELGSVREEDAELLVAPPAQRVREALARLSARAAAARASGREVMAIVYVSSHASQGALHLGPTALPMEELRAAVEALPASMRLLVLDACSSGGATRLKGGRLVAAPQQLSVEPARGTIIITSSGPAEPSQEWDSLKGSLFTHGWLAGLRGAADANQDGAVTVVEAYAHAWRQTLARADQHPSFDFDLRGSGEPTLTEPSRSRSALSFPRGLGGRFVVVSEPDARLVLELERDASRPLRLAVPPGTYRVRRSAPEGAGQALIELPQATTRALSDEDFTVAASPRVALKGGPGPLSLALGVTARGGPDAPLLGAVGFARQDLGALWLAASLSIGTASSAGRQDLEAGLGLAAGTGLEVGLFRLGLGLVVRPLLVSRLEGATRALGAGVEGAGQLQLEVTLAARLFLGAQVEGGVGALPLEVTVSPAFAWRASLLSGVKF